MKKQTRATDRKWTAASILLTWLLLCLSPGRLLLAQIPSLVPTAPDKSVEATPEDPFGRSTPYGTVMGFARAAQSLDFDRAVQYLDTTRKGEKAQTLARQLQSVLDKRFKQDLSKLSRKPEGDLADGLKPTRELIGTVEIPAGELTIFLDRIDRKGQGPIWLFSSETLARIPEAAQQMGSFDLEKHIPRVLVQNKVLSFPLYSWIGLILGLAFALLLGSLITRALVPLVRRLLRGITSEEDKHSIDSVRAPIRLILIAAAIRLFSVISLTFYMRQFWIRVSVVVAIIGLTWLLIQFVGILSTFYTRHLRSHQMAGRIAMWSLINRLLKALIIIAAILWLLHFAGADLTAVLTGLGVGGVAVAFAAQKTLENLFGGMMIISDEPIRVGDFCRVGDQMGTVEDIGLRSTRIRTLMRTLVSIPNGQLATMNIENFSLRDKFWLHHVVGLRYETSKNQLDRVLDELRGMLLSHPKVEAADARARFVKFGSFSLDLEIFAYIKTTVMAEFLEVQEEILLRIMNIVAACGAQIAFPSQTTYIARDVPPEMSKRGDVETK
jgi:MscS family membrane protein